MAWRSHSKRFQPRMQITTKNRYYSL